MTAPAFSQDAGWAPAFARIATERGAPQRPAFVSADVPGLCVAHVKADSYAITHVESGCTLGGGTWSLDDAKALALRLSPLADWTQPMAVLQPDEILKERVKLAYRQYWQSRSTRATRGAIA